MANILGMKDVAAVEGAMVIMNTKSGKEIIVALKDGTIFELKQFFNGLYYIDTDKDDTNRGELI